MGNHQEGGSDTNYLLKPSTLEVDFEWVNIAVLACGFKVLSAVEQY